MHRRHGVSVLVSLATLVLCSGNLSAQDQSEWGSLEDDSARVVELMGDALLLRASGPTISETRLWDEENRINYTWYMVQDTSLGLVFRKPSGLKRGNWEGRSAYDADIDLRSLEPIRAFEIESLVFSIWGDFEGLKTATRFRELDSGDETDIDPRWPDSSAELRRHAVSITYISRVRKADGSIVVADRSLALEAAQSIDADATYQVLEPETESEGETEQGG